MKVLNYISQIFPLSLLGMYVILFLCAGLDTYENYRNLYLIADVTLMSLTIIGAVIFINKWKLITKISLIAILLLNILTEIDSRHPLEYYHDLYLYVILIFFLSMCVFSITNKHKT